MTAPEAPSFGLGSGTAFVVELEQFTGPLDLLLHLLREEQIEIADIPIARIADQFLRVIHELGQNQAADYLEMASRLVRLKAQMLLPRPGDLMRLELQGKAGDPRAAATQFAQTNQIRFEAGREERIAGHRAFRALARVPARQGELGIDMTCISHPSGMFRIAGMAPVARFNAYAPVFQSAARSFHDLSAAERESMVESRLRLVQARPGESIDALSRRAGNSWSVERTAIANALAGGAILTAGQTVKIARAEPYRSR